jgi:hypothetical protein
MSPEMWENDLLLWYSVHNDFYQTPGKLHHLSKNQQRDAGTLNHRTARRVYGTR